MSELDELEKLAFQPKNELDELESLAYGKGISPQRAAAEGLLPKYEKAAPKLSLDYAKDAQQALTKLSPENKQVYGEKIAGALDIRNQILGDVQKTAEVLAGEGNLEGARKLVSGFQTVAKESTKPIRTIAHGIDRGLRSIDEYTRNNLYTPYTPEDEKAGVEEGISLFGARRRAAQLPFTEGKNHPVTEEEWARRIRQLPGGEEVFSTLGKAGLASLATPIPGGPTIANALIGAIGDKTKAVTDTIGEQLVLQGTSLPNYLGFGAGEGANIGRQVYRASKATVGADRAAELAKLIQPFMHEAGTPQLLERLVSGLTREGVPTGDIIKVLGEEGQYLGKTGLRVSLPGEAFGANTPGVDLSQIAGKLGSEHPIKDTIRAGWSALSKGGGKTLPWDQNVVYTANQLRQSRGIEQALENEYLARAAKLQEHEAKIPEGRLNDLIKEAIDPAPGGSTLNYAPLQKHEQDWIDEGQAIFRDLRDVAVNKYGANVPKNLNKDTGKYWHRLYEEHPGGVLAEKVIKPPQKIRPTAARYEGTGKPVGAAGPEDIVNIDPKVVFSKYIKDLSRTAAIAESNNFAIKNFGFKGRKLEKRMAKVGDIGILEKNLSKAEKKQIANDLRARFAPNIYNQNPLAPPQVLSKKLSSAVRAKYPKAVKNEAQVAIPANIYNMLQRNASRGTGRLAPVVADSKLVKQFPGTAGKAVKAVANIHDYLNDKFKRAALISPAHHIKNVIDDSVKMAVQGVNPLEVVAAISDVLKQTPNYKNAQQAGVSLGRANFFDLTKKPADELAWIQKQERVKQGIDKVTPGYLAKKAYRKVEGTSEKVGTLWNDLSRMAVYNNEMAKSGSPINAAAKTAKTLFDYQDTTQPYVGATISTARQLMPFGNYNIRSAISAPAMALEHPGRVRNVFRMYENDEPQLEPPENFANKGVSITQNREQASSYGKVREFFGGRGSQYDSGLSQNMLPNDQFHQAGNWIGKDELVNSLGPVSQMVGEQVTGRNSFTGNQQGMVSGLLPSRARALFDLNIPGLYANTGDASALQYGSQYLPRPVGAISDYLVSKDPAMPTSITSAETGLRDFPEDARSQKMMGFSLGMAPRVEFPGLAQKLIENAYSPEVQAISPKVEAGPGAKLKKEMIKLKKIVRRQND